MLFKQAKEQIFLNPKPDEEFTFYSEFESGNLCAAFKNENIENEFDLIL